MTTFAGLNPPRGGGRGGKLVADVHDQQPFEPVEWGLRVVLSEHFCVSLHVGHAKMKQDGIKVQEYLPEAKIKTRQTMCNNDDF